MCEEIVCELVIFKKVINTQQMVLKNFLLFVLLSSMLVSAHGIRCYQCNSEIEPECHDLGKYSRHLTKGFYKECADYSVYNGSIPFCRKTQLTVILPDKDERTIRSCGWIKSHLKCYKTDNDDHLETNCQCFDDGCNGSSQVKVFNVFGFLVIGAFMLS